VIVSRRGVTWDVDAPDDFWSRLWPSWEEYTLDVVDRFARENATLVDVGAWIGPVSLWAARRGPVLAVEPDPVAFGYLCGNVAKNAPEDVETIDVAVTVATMPVGLRERGEYGNSMSYVSPLGGEVVQGHVFRDLLDPLDSVSLVKMDIEGGECDVLEHAAPYCAERGIPLLVSMHEPWWTRPVDPEWFSGFTSVEGSFSGWGQVLCS
jgi:FkbM family methyltransferase